MLPETDVAITRRFSVEDPTAVRRVLDDLVRARAAVVLYLPTNFQVFLVSRLLGHDSRGLVFDFFADPLLTRPLLGGNALIVVAMLESIKVQFVAPDPVQRRSPDGPELLCGLPAEVIRIQRREDFRVRPPVRSPVVCVMRAPGGSEDRFQVSDISAAGVALLAPAGGTLPQPGEIREHCRLEIPGLPAIPCDLEVRTHGALDRGSVRVGCRFLRPAPESQRAVQRYVMDVECGRVPLAGPVRPACS